MKSRLADRVDKLLGELEGVEPPFESLGTPVLGESDALDKLVSMGAEIVPLLVERTRENVGGKKLAYIALVLSRIGERQAAEPLRALRARLQAWPAKDQWDYAAIGQCDIALARLSELGG
jgi:hypothetical protein